MFIQNIENGKWPPFRSENFHMHFLKRKCGIVIEISIEFVQEDAITLSPLCLTQWRRPKQATCHPVKHCWQKWLVPYEIIKPQWVNASKPLLYHAWRLTNHHSMIMNFQILYVKQYSRLLYQILVRTLMCTSFFIKFISNDHTSLYTWRTITRPSKLATCKNVRKGSQASPTALTLQTPKRCMWSPWLFQCFKCFITWIWRIVVIISSHGIRGPFHNLLSCSNLYHNDPVRFKICTCRGSSAVDACVKVSLIWSLVFISAQDVFYNIWIINS